MTSNTVPPCRLGSLENVYSGGTLLNDGGITIKNISLVDGDYMDVQNTLLKSKFVKKV